VDWNSQPLIDWFLKEKRKFPWRQGQNPYHIWISEIMLQQTRADVVIPYFERFIALFPDIKTLAKASLDEIIKAWEGLGYYSRARYIHEAARSLIERGKEQLPQDETELKGIKGIGDYTAGAILSFAFHKRAACVDGNVLRVFSRYLALEDDISQGTTRKKIQTEILKILPQTEHWIVSEAFIELGALVCKKKPECIRCPLISTCKAYLTGREKELPIKKKTEKKIFLYRAVAIVFYEDQVLLRKVPEGEIMQDLYEFPYKPLEKQGIMLETAEELFKTLTLEIQPQTFLQPVRHTFTKHLAILFPFVFIAEKKRKVQGYTWQCMEKLKKLPFSSGHRRIRNEILQSAAEYRSLKK
jgi:A/G-specific adenine glycosylase